MATGSRTGDSPSTRTAENMSYQFRAGLVFSYKTSSCRICSTHLVRETLLMHFELSISFKKLD
jgi:hypothetical protein